MRWHTGIAFPIGFSLLSMALPAAAQSQVSINGLIDAGVYRGFDGVNQMGTIQRSNLAISGLEDLGGGLKATFRLSTRFDMDTGQSEGAGSKPFWYDESTVGLQGSFGHLRMGRALSAMWSQDWKFDPWANFNRIASPAWYQWHYLTPTDRYSNNGSAEYGRMANGIFYDSPTIAGFTLHLSASPERTEVPVTLRREGRGYSASLNYDSDSLSGMLAFERNSSGDKDTFAAAKYRFGPAAVMAAWDYSRVALNASTAKAITLGATYQMGDTTLKAGYGRQRMQEQTNHFYSLGADYAVSKRTTLYASLGRKSYEYGADSGTSFGVGMAHAF
ncbi:porin [Comamonas testosteroni]|uniref:Porin n=1 Tax=Comamonas testosteroni TaxID=285 RepID=A0A373FQ81_COMTE|nr:porin [Comamonas testosteroni]RGE46303.1 porin [Comamonas testosteroni]